ncbi:hypothetical protein DICVIV_04775 [Dictyocaulus viviparus]|uniref:Myb-like domain-containing protein n=1 Tax=Dictyocaulus viviparus TaxID=29172 RepID=A0A0D8XWM7_DICVI|nr:hypothetical protein DICVIV_04775 [Dictyocaulus viviparus]
MFVIFARKISTTVKQVEEQNIHETRRITPLPRVPEFTYEVATDLKAVSSNDPEIYAKYQDESEKNVKKQDGNVWSCEELQQLARLAVEKFPPGTTNRWERVAHILNRTAQDTAAMAAKLKKINKEELAKLTTGQQSSANFNMQSGNWKENSFVEKCPLGKFQIWAIKYS